MVGLDKGLKLYRLHVPGSQGPCWPSTSSMPEENEMESGNQGSSIMLRS